MDMISANEYKINGKELKIRVEEAPEKSARKRHFWKAVDALKTMKTENVDFVIEPSTLGIHDNKTLDRLGIVDEDGYCWNGQVLAAAFPDIDVTELRRATLHTPKQ